MDGLPSRVEWSHTSPEAITGNRPSPIWFVVKATPLVDVVELLTSQVGCTASQIDV